MGGSNCGVPFVGDGRPFPSSFPGSFPCLKRSETASWKDRISRAGLSVCLFFSLGLLWGWLIFRAREAEKAHRCRPRARRARLKPHGTQKGMQSISSGKRKKAMHYWDEH